MYVRLSLCILWIMQCKINVNWVPNLSEDVCSCDTQYKAGKHRAKQFATTLTGNNCTLFLHYTCFCHRLSRWMNCCMGQQPYILTHS
jgi:hypothetical protein